ncbi:MAG: hypothetical protein WDA16_03650 [Candidatus Thermoplasmatota archaeon]
MDDVERGPDWGRVVFSLALLLVALVAVTAGGRVVQEAPATEASLFGAPIVDLRLKANGSVSGFINLTNAAPGDRASGKLVLSSRDLLPRDVFDLDFDVRPTNESSRGSRLASALVLTSLAYGADDLLRDPARNLTREIDANALKGNGDGLLTLGELEAGANDLPAPRDTAHGGTPFTIGVRFDPTERDGASYAGARITFDFVFSLADRSEPDLN